MLSLLGDEGSKAQKGVVDCTSLVEPELQPDLIPKTPRGSTPSGEPPRKVPWRVCIPEPCPRPMVSGAHLRVRESAVFRNSSGDCNRH